MLAVGTTLVVSNSVRAESAESAEKAIESKVMQSIDRNRDGLPDRDREGNLPTHAWFAAFAPFDDPEIAVIVFIFGGGEGSGTAVPVANDILNYYFSQDTGASSP
jgi:penicillin-binding protein 2